MRDLLSTKRTIRLSAWVVAGILAITFLVIYIRLHAEVAISHFRPPNNIDSEEASRKIEIFNKAVLINKKGHVKLTETEINSRVLLKHILKYDDENETLRLKKYRVKIVDDHTISIIAWIEGPIYGFQRSLVWTRTYQYEGGSTLEHLKLTSMQVGKVTISNRFQPIITARLARIDQRFQSSLEWLRGVPRFEIHADPNEKEPYLKLYTFAENH